jgi:hypothetical protein
MPNRISTSKVIQQQVKGVATNFVADVASTFVNNLFGGNRPTPNFLVRKDGNFRLATLAENLYYDNEKRPASNAMYVAPVNPYRVDVNVENGIKTGNIRVTEKTDWRVRLDLGKTNNNFYKSPLLLPLQKTNGVVFPYTPQLAITHTATYVPSPITHANFQHYTYANSDVGAINITGDFTAQNEVEGQYLLAVIHFFRAVTKMYFGGDKSPRAGTPPPILFLTAHGPMLFNRVPVVVTSFVSTFPSDANYLYVESAGGQTRVPTMMSLAVTVQPVFNRQQAKTFSLDKFVNGGLLTQGYI